MSFTQPSRTPNPDRLTFYLLKNLNRAVREFAMIAEGDRVAVAVSGGKDSCALLHLLLARQPSAPERHRLVALHVHMGPAGLTNLRPTLEPWFVQLGVEYVFAPLELAEDEKPPLDCQRCAWNRHKALFTAAHNLGCNKLALAHHADDAAETTLLNLLQTGRLETLLPCREYFGGAITLIRPLIYTEERRLAQLARALSLPQDQPTCPHAGTSRRAWVKRWLSDAGRSRAQMRVNLWRAARRQMGF